MCIQWALAINCLNQHFPQFNSLCNGFTRVWSMFVYNTTIKRVYMHMLACVVCQATDTLSVS